MTFKHKLAHRLALLRNALLLLSATTLACERAFSPETLVPTVAQFRVSPKATALQPNQVADFMAVGLTASGDTAPVAVTWSVTGGSIVDTSSNHGRHYGRYKAGAVCGQFDVAATSHPGKKSDTAAVTVACVASVDVTPAAASFPVGGTVQLTATPKDDAGNPLPGWAITWSSSDAGVATVNSSGLVTGVAAGAATISATSEGKSGSSGVTVTAAIVPVASVDVTPTSASVVVGGQVQLTATPRDANGNPLSGRTITWSSSNTSVATVNSSGLVTGVAAGSATVTATSEGKSGSSAVTVTPVTVPVASVDVTPTSASVVVGGQVQLTATPRDANGNPLSGRTITWSSSNTSVATVNSSGLVTGVAAGLATITATSEGKSGTSAVTVTTVPVASVTVSPASATIAVGGTVQLSATPKDANGNPLAGRTVTWASNNTGVATVNSSGRVTGVAVGSATITATSEGQSGTSAITVIIPPVASVVVSPPSASVQVGATVQLTATLKDSAGNTLTGRTVTWVSSNTSLATVSSGGLVTGVAVGAATITATSEGKSGSAAVTVTAPPPPGSSVVLVGAGDIATCGGSGDEATANLLDNIPGTVFTAGDNAYSDGTDANFSQCYDPTWGRHKARTRPSPGNHDYHTSGAAGYYNYFGANAGPSGRGYYSYDLGDWHIISLNSNVSMSAGSAQEQWLRGDLAASTKQCTIAYWHHPRFSSGSHGSSTSPKPLWQALYDAGAEIVIVGHDHNYQRFAPQTPDGQADPVKGIREFVAGMGGASHYNFSSPIANTEAYNTDTYGVLKLTLGPGAYSWEFIPVAGKTYTDSGSGTCH